MAPQMVVVAILGALETKANLTTVVYDGDKCLNVVCQPAHPASSTLA